MDNSTQDNYGAFRAEFVQKISDQFPCFDADTINRICNILDSTASNYNVSKQETSIITYSFDLPDEAKQYLVAKKIEGLSPNTLENRKIFLTKFFQFVNKPVRNIRADDIRLFLYDYQKRRNISDRSLETIRVSLSSFFSWLVDNEIIEKNVSHAVRPIKYAKVQRHALTNMELEIVRFSCKDAREIAMIEFMFSTGCRVSELCGVKMSDVNFDACTVRLFGKGKKERTSYLNAKAVVSLRHYLKTLKFKSEYLFPSLRAPHNMIKPAAVEKIIRQIEMRIDGKISKHLTPHVIRHTTATHALKSGMPIEQISQLLGHSDIAVTRIYAETQAEDLQASHAKYIQ